MSNLYALKLIVLSATICALVAGLLMSIVARGMAICPFDPPLLAKECVQEIRSIAIFAALNSAWKGALLGTAIGATIVYWKSRKA